MDIKRLLTIGIIAISCGLVGCALKKPVTPADSVGPDANVKLAEAATSVSRSLDDLAAVQEANTPGYYAYQSLPHLNRDSMPGAASIDWSGPIQPLLKRIANISGYRLRVLGKSPGIPIIVTITKREAPLADIVRDISYQAVGRAKVYVYPRSRIIELRYLTP